MLDEEKKAVEWFREDLAEEKENCGKYNDYKKQVIKRNEKILNLIKKQSKQIEELQAINQMQKYRIEVMDERELISRDEVENIITSEIKEIEKEQEEYKNGQEWEIQDELAGQKGVLQSILDKIKGDDKK